MVTDWGMSEKLGPINYVKEDPMAAGWYGQTTTEPDLSAKTKETIDQEIHSILNQSYKAARILLEKNKVMTERVAKALLKYETLTVDDVNAILDGADINSLKPELTDPVLKTPKQAEEEKRRELAAQKEAEKGKPELPDINVQPRPETG